MDKEQLSQLYYLNREIEMLKKQLGATKPQLATDSVKGSDISFPYTQHSIMITGIDWQDYEQKIKRLQNQISRRVSKLMDTLNEINEFIDSIEDAEIRQIVSLRYVNNLTWQQVAFHIGCHDEGVPRKKCERFLKTSEKSEMDVVE